jgi:hypothetical protein
MIISLGDNWLWDRSHVKGVPELRISQVSFVVDLHLFVVVDTAHRAALEVLQSKLCLHGSAGVGRVTDEARLAESAAVCAGSFEIKHNVTGVVGELG